MVGLHWGFFHTRRLTPFFFLLSFLFTCPIFTPVCTSSASVAQSCLCNPMDYSPADSCPWDSPGKNRGSSQPRNWTLVSCTAGRLFTSELPGKPSSSKSVLNLACPNPSLIFMTSVSLLCERLLPKNFTYYFCSTAKHTKPINSILETSLKPVFNNACEEQFQKYC